MDEYKNEFENYPKLARYIERLYHRGGMGCSGGEWSDFLNTINSSLQEAKGMPQHNGNTIIHTSSLFIEKQNMMVIIATTKFGKIWRWSSKDGWECLPPIPQGEPHDN